MLRVSCVVFLCAFFACAYWAAADQRAHCRLIPTNTHGAPFNLSGEVTFTLVSDPSGPLVQVEADISGSSAFDGSYAMHVHEFGDITDRDAATRTGSHFQGGNADHNCPPETDRHRGDMGSWDADEGVLQQSKSLDLLQLSGQYSIVGLAVILHQLVDSCENPLGAAGTRYAQCVIGIQNTEANGAAGADFTVDNSALVCSMQPTPLCEDCAGTVYFQQEEPTDPITITAELEGITGVHAVLIHQFGDLSEPDGGKVGDHYNPFGSDHALPPTIPRHIGDLGNVQSYDPETGHAWYYDENSYIPSLSQLVGRTLVIHQGRDHGQGANCVDGSPGPALMMCVIGVMNPAQIANIPEVPDGVEIDNDFENAKCRGSSDDDEDDNGGLVAGLVVGWVFVGILLLALIGAAVLFIWFSSKRKAGGF